MKPEPGTYALILHGGSHTDVSIGRWGRLSVRPGYYVYVGSAFGPGGVRARVSRHFRTAKRKHWHIDYLCAVLEPVCAWCSYLPRRLEHGWAQTFAQLNGVSCVAGFGSSDCSCPGHLVVTSTQPDAARFLEAASAAIEIWPDQASVRRRAAGGE